MLPVRAVRAVGLRAGVAVAADVLGADVAQIRVAVLGHHRVAVAVDPLDLIGAGVEDLALLEQHPVLGAGADLVVAQQILQATLVHEAAAEAVAIVVVELARVAAQHTVVTEQRRRQLVAARGHDVEVGVGVATPDLEQIVVGGLDVGRQHVRQRQRSTVGRGLGQHELTGVEARGGRREAREQVAQGQPLGGEPRELAEEARAVGDDRVGRGLAFFEVVALDLQALGHAPVVVEVERGEVPQLLGDDRTAGGHVEHRRAVAGLGDRHLGGTGPVPPDVEDVVLGVDERVLAVEGRRAAVVLVAAVLGDDVDLHPGELAELGGRAVGVDLDLFDRVEVQADAHPLGRGIPSRDAVERVVVAVLALPAHAGVAVARTTGAGVDPPGDAGDGLRDALVGATHRQVLDALLAQRGRERRLGDVDHRLEDDLDLFADAAHHRGDARAGGRLQGDPDLSAGEQRLVEGDRDLVGARRDAVEAVGAVGARRGRQLAGQLDARQGDRGVGHDQAVFVLDDALDGARLASLGDLDGHHRGEEGGEHGVHLAPPVVGVPLAPIWTAAPGQSIAPVSAVVP